MSLFVSFVTFFVYAVSLVSPLPDTNKNYRSDYVYNTKTDAFYKLHTEIHTHTDAQNVCAVEGANLMPATTRQDLIQVHGMLKQFPDIASMVWVANDNQQHESAEEPAIIDFDQPTEAYAPAYNKQCDVITRKGEEETARCGQRLPFVCKVAANSLPYNSQCDVYASGYERLSNMSSCYKIPRIAYTWNEAFADCQAEGAHLVILNSQAEHDAIYQLMKDTRKVEGSQASHFYFAGFRADVPTDGKPRVFKTIFNETLEEAGYSTWADNEPNNYNNKEDCGALFTNDGKLNDLYCTNVHGFICEKEITPK